jgi:hypothetical protein
MVLAALPILGTGCSSDPARTPIIDEEEAKLDRLPRTMRVSSAFGGAHRRMLVEGNTWLLAENDVMVVPSWHSVQFRAGPESILFSYSDRPVQQALGLWREQRA